MTSTPVDADLLLDLPGGRHRTGWPARAMETGFVSATTAPSPIVWSELGGRGERTLPDFLIGAHAAIRGYALLTRHPPGFRTHFPDLAIIAPDTHP